MTLFEELFYNLSDFDTLYRIQGGNSKIVINLKASAFSIDANGYLYVSKTVRHHKYFLDKRIKQMVDEIFFDRNKFMERNMFKRRIDYLNAIIEGLKDDTLDLSLEAIQIVTFPTFQKLLSNNVVLTKDKITGTSFVERVDVKNGEGYGFNDEWLELFYRFITIIAKRRISKSDIIKYLNILKLNVCTNEKIDPTCILNNPRMEFAFNSGLENDFIKYEIIQLLETILEKGLALETSELYQNPKETIKKTVSEYQEYKGKVLKRLDTLAKARML